MTANPIKPARYRPGKAIAESHSSSEEDEDDEDQDHEKDNKIQTSAIPPPKATSFPGSESTRIVNNLKAVDLNERRRRAAAEQEAERAARAKEEEGFETASSEDGDVSGSEKAKGSESGSGSESDEEASSSSSEEEAPKILLRPTFIRKEQRGKGKNGESPIAGGGSMASITGSGKTSEEQWAEEEARRKDKADELVQEQLEKNAAAKAAGKKSWDDDEDNIDAEDMVDDTDGLDPEAELAAWKLRELKRVKREREAIEIAEQEREEVERRRGLTVEEREREDREFLDKQKEDREGKGKMGYLQKYYHKGAFFQDESADEAGKGTSRDIMGSRYADDVVNRELLPQYMQIRDMTKLGRKGRTKYKDLKSEDTGRWGTYEGKRRADGSLDERFMPDRDGSGGGPGGASGANAIHVGERRQVPDGAPAGPRAEKLDREPVDRYVPVPDPDPDRSRDHNEERRRPRSCSRSPARRRDGHRDDERDGRKRSRSPRGDRYDSDKRRKVEAA